MAGTPIAMADGTRRPIERIRIGDWVLAYDVEAGVVVSAPVLRTFAHERQDGGDSIIRINGALRATSNHPFYANGRWVSAGELGVSDELLVLEPSTEGGVPMAQAGVVSSLYVESEREATYNLTVGTHHNYFAGGVLVHNKPPCLEEP
ncbi:Hint domain-containing protein [Sorangium sp. So ce134]